MKLLTHLLIASILGGLIPSAFAHGHINAGKSGDKLFMYFEEGTETTVLAYNNIDDDSEGYAAAAVYREDGYLWSGNTTMTALHQSSFNDPDNPDIEYYDPNGALSGSYIVLSLVSITGPTGAKLAFYESLATDPTFVYEIGTDLATPLTINLTESSWFNGTPSDPFGHIHGRMFGVDTAGDYQIEWVLKDTRSGAGAMLDSDIFTQSFTAAAIPEPSTWLLLGAGAVLLVVLRRRISSNVA